MTKEIFDWKDGSIGKDLNNGTNFGDLNNEWIIYLDGTVFDTRIN
jgi:hypothetical protein